MPQMKYDFSDLAKQIVASLKKAADDQVNEANNLQASVDVLAEGIYAQIAEHAKLLDEMDGRLRGFGESVLEAHKKFLNGSKHDQQSVDRANPATTDGVKGAGSAGRLPHHRQDAERGI
jgi:hypothetical protein